MGLTTKEILYNTGAFAVSYLILNYLIPNDNLNYFTKSFFVTSGVIASGWTNNFIYQKATGDKRPLIGLGSSNIRSTELDVLCEKDEETEVAFDFDIGNYIFSLIYDNRANMLNVSFSKNDYDELDVHGTLSTPDGILSFELTRDKRLVVISKEFLIIQLVILDLSG